MFTSQRIRKSSSKICYLCSKQFGEKSLHKISSWKLLSRVSSIHSEALKGWLIHTEWKRKTLLSSRKSLKQTTKIRSSFKSMLPKSFEAALINVCIISCVPGKAACCSLSFQLRVCFPWVVSVSWKDSTLGFLREDGNNSKYLEIRRQRGALSPSAASFSLPRWSFYVQLQMWSWNLIIGAEAVREHLATLRSELIRFNLWQISSREKQFMKPFLACSQMAKVKKHSSAVAAICPCVQRVVKLLLRKIWIKCESPAGLEELPIKALSFTAISLLTHELIQASS